MTAQGVRKLEQAEANGTITLNTLARLAHGLDCEVHYMFVPRTSLVEQVLNRTQEIAGIALPSTLKGAEVLTDAETLPKANLTVFAQPHLGVAFRCSFAKSKNCRSSSAKRVRSRRFFKGANA